MYRFFLFLLTKVLVHLPLNVVHSLGIIIGRVFHALKPSIKKTLIHNLACANIFTTQSSLNAAVKVNVSEIGKTMMESFVIWASPQSRLLKWIVKVNGQELIDAALARKKGIIFLTPHLGSYEITSIYYGSQHPLTILYRRPRKKWLFNFIVQGRSKGFVKLAETNAAGVKQLFQALKNGEAIGILPDQIASKGQGEHADFFGRPAYTMVLLSKLALKTEAAIIMAVGERLQNSKGFVIHLQQLDTAEIATPEKLNHALELQIRKFPLQYLWNYDRYKPQALS